MTALTRLRRISAVQSGSALVLISVLAMQSGQAVAKLGFVLASPLVITALRFGWGALVLTVLWRPRLPTDRHTLAAVFALGTALAGVNLFLYASVARIPLGLAVAVQFTGALVVALVRARRPRHVLWALLALGGVVLIHDQTASAVSGPGLAFALISAVCWGAYILLAAHVGARIPGGGGIALATLWAALFTMPLGVVTHPHAFGDLRVLGIGLAVALLCTALANSLEIHALRHIPPRVFSVLVSLEPAVAALAGLLLLDEHLTSLQWLAIAAIVLAALGVTMDNPTTGTPSSTADQGSTTPRHLPNQQQC